MLDDILLNRIEKRKSADPVSDVPVYLRPAVAAALARLKREKHIYHDPGFGWKLTDQGKRIAENQNFRLGLVGVYIEQATAIIQELEGQVKRPGDRFAGLSRQTASAGMVSVYRIWDKGEPMPHYIFEYDGPAVVSIVNQVTAGPTEEELRQAAATILAHYLIS